MKVRISLEASELDDRGRWESATASIERPEHADEDMRYQELVMNRAELAALYARLTLYFTQGIWSAGTVENYR